jgi:hypothetical protein
VKQALGISGILALLICIPAAGFNSLKLHLQTTGNVSEWIILAVAMGIAALLYAIRRVVIRLRYADKSN